MPARDLHLDYFAALSDPPGASPLIAALQWLQGVLLGTVATTIAIIAIAALGLLLMTGRIDWRRGATTLIGCFILFGAPRIAAGVQDATEGGWFTSPARPLEQSEPAVALPPASVPPPQPGAPHEPVL